MYKLVVDDIHKRFGDHEVLKGVSLKAKAGDVISIIGSSGSGKAPSCAASTFWSSRVPDISRWMTNACEPNATGAGRCAFRMHDSCAECVPSC